MRSKTFQQVLNSTYRKVSYCVNAYSQRLITGVKRRFHYYFSKTQFSLGIGFSKTTGISGWKYMLSLDLGFFCCWVYFCEIK